jgi:hypothetical protein
MRKILFLLTAAVLLFSACMAPRRGSTSQSTGPAAPLKPDVDFARDTLLLLVKGDPTVEEMIDWETLKTFETDAGSTYSYMPGESAKAAFRKSFIQGFSSPYRSSGEIPDWLSRLSNWRVEAKEASRTIVIADHPFGKTLVIVIVLKDGRQKLSSINGRERSP